MSNKLNSSMSLAKPDAVDLSSQQKIAVGLGIAGAFIRRFFSNLFLHHLLH